MDKFMRYKEEQGAKGMTFHHVGDDEARAKLMKYRQRVERPRWVSQPAERAGRRGARAQAKLDAREAALTAPQKMQRLSKRLLSMRKLPPPLFLRLHARRKSWQSYNLNIR